MNNNRENKKAQNYWNTFLKTPRTIKEPPEYNKIPTRYLLTNNYNEKVQQTTNWTTRSILKNDNEYRIKQIIHYINV